MLLLPGGVVLLDHAEEVDAQYQQWNGRWQVLAGNEAGSNGTQPEDARDAAEEISEVGSGSDTEETRPQSEVSCAHAHAPMQSAECHAAPHGTDHAHGPAAAGTVDGSGPAGTAGGSRPRKRKRKQQLSQAELDARHPGNIRNRAAGTRVAAAFETLQAWLAGAGPEEERKAAAAMLTRKMQVTSTAAGLQRRARDASQLETWGLEGGDMPQLAPCSSRDQSQQQASEGETNRASGSTDWRTLYEVRAAVRPKAQVLGPVHCASQALAILSAAGISTAGFQPLQHLHTRDVTLEQEQTLIRPQATGGCASLNGQVMQPEATQLQHQPCDNQHQSCQPATIQNDIQLPPIDFPNSESQISQPPTNLFGTLVVNPYPCDTLALAHTEPVLMPAGAGCLMTDVTAKGALAPLLRSGGCMRNQRQSQFAVLFGHTALFRLRMATWR